MFRRTLICLAVTTLGVTSLDAQRLEANLQRIEVPGAGFEILLATPKTPAVMINLGESPEALVVPLVGNALTLTFEDGADMLAALEHLRHPGHSFLAPGRDGNPSRAAALYIVPKSAPKGSSAR